METAAEKDFIHVEDVVEAFMLAANKEFECEAFNVGIGTAHAFSNVINLLSECLKRNVKPIYSLTP